MSVSVCVCEWTIFHGKVVQYISHSSIQVHQNAFREII